jgi:hypothetical protein
MFKQTHYMIKTCFLSLWGLMIFFIGFSQDTTENTEQKVGKYMVKLLTNADNTYGFEIYQESKLIEKQTQKPFFTFSSGFVQKKNAMIMGVWYATELLEGRNNKYALSLLKAKDLGITEEDLQNNLPK